MGRTVLFVTRFCYRQVLSAALLGLFGLDSPGWAESN